MNKDCVVCNAIKDEVFPFQQYGDGYYLDSEGCIEGNTIKINFCPVCGTTLSPLQEKQSKE